MSDSTVIKRLVVCFGSIQLVTALSVLNYRESQHFKPNVHFKNYLVIPPLFAPQGQNDEFAAFIQKMAESIYSWEKIIYFPLETRKSLQKTLKLWGISGTIRWIHKRLEVEQFDEIYLTNNYDFESLILMNAYENAVQICYGNGIGIYTPQPAFPPPSPLKKNSLSELGNSLKTKIKALVNYRNQLQAKTFDIGYFSLSSAWGEVPEMPSLQLGSDVYLATFEKFRKILDKLIDIQYINDLRGKIQANPITILLTSNFSEAAGRMSLENEITAYREFLEAQEIPENSVLLIKPHPRDSKHKLQELKAALSHLYSEIFLITEDCLFYLPFEILFMELFCHPKYPTAFTPQIRTFSSACLTLEFVLDVRCLVGFGNELVQKFFYQDHIMDRIKHESDLLATIQQISSFKKPQNLLRSRAK